MVIVRLISSILRMGLSSSSSISTPRNWGPCLEDCLHRSEIYYSERCGVRYIGFWFKHWCVYIYVKCEEHGVQRWTVEKELSSCDPAKRQHYFSNHCIVFWCGYYDSDLCKENSRCVRNEPLIRAYDIAMKWKKNGYNLIIDNCGTFANEIDKALQFYD